MKPTATLETAGASAKPAATMETASAVETTVAASEAAAVKTPAATETRPTVVTASIATTVVAPAIEPTTVATTIEAMEPRAGADKHAAHEVVRAPVSIRRASVRVIRVVTPVTHRRGTDVSGADSHAHNDLRVRRSGRCKHANCK